MWRIKYYFKANGLTITLTKAKNINTHYRDFAHQYTEAMLLIKVNS
jgi:hypothetical protein